MKNNENEEKKSEMYDQMAVDVGNIYVKYLKYFQLYDVSLTMIMCSLHGLAAIKKWESKDEYIDEIDDIISRSIDKSCSEFDRYQEKFKSKEPQ